MNIMKKAAVLFIIAILLCSCTKIESTLPDSEYNVFTVTDAPAVPYADGHAADDTSGGIGIPNASADKKEKINYIYESLSPEEKVFYGELKAAAEGYTEKVVFSENIDSDTARKIFYAVYNQEPQIFWLDGLFYQPNDNEQLLKYRVPQEQIPDMRGQIDEVCRRLLERAEGMTDYQKTVFFHDYLVRNTVFNANTENLTIYGAFCVGTAQCEGYAFAYKYLCDLSGINCIVVPGANAEGDTHAWNMVDLDGIWYNVDCTWDDPVLPAENSSADFLRRYYLLVPDSDILNITHFRREDYFDYPSCYDGSRTYFAREGLLADSASQGTEMLKNAAAQALSEGHKDAEVRFLSAADYRAAINNLFDMGGIKAVAVSALEAAGLDSSVGITGMVKYLNDDLYIIHITFG